MSNKDPQIHWIHVASSVAANTATVAGSIFINPTHSSTVNLYIAGGGNGADTPAPPTAPVQLTTFYKGLAGGLFVVAVVCLFLEIYLGFSWPEPTAAQANIIGAVDYGWKVGIGFVVGLITGKSVVP